MKVTQCPISVPFLIVNWERSCYILFLLILKIVSSLAAQGLSCGM